jgi:hypothetical protein
VTIASRSAIFPEEFLCPENTGNQQISPRIPEKSLRQAGDRERLLYIPLSVQECQEEETRERHVSGKRDLPGK